MVISLFFLAKYINNPLKWPREIARGARGAAKWVCKIANPLCRPAKWVCKNAKPFCKPARSVRVAAKLFGRMVRRGKRNPAIRGERIAGREGDQSKWKLSASFQAGNFSRKASSSDFLMTQVRVISSRLPAVAIFLPLGSITIESPR